jgi:hypothetical protein
MNVINIEKDKRVISPKGIKRYFDMMKYFLKEKDYVGKFMQYVKNTPKFVEAMTAMGILLVHILVGCMFYECVIVHGPGNITDFYILHIFGAAISIIGIAGLCVFDVSLLCAICLEVFKIVKKWWSV